MLHLTAATGTGVLNATADRLQIVLSVLMSRCSVSTKRMWRLLHGMTSETDTATVSADIMSESMTGTALAADDV